MLSIAHDSLHSWCHRLWTFITWFQLEILPSLFGQCCRVCCSDCWSMTGLTTMKFAKKAMPGKVKSCEHRTKGWFQREAKIVWRCFVLLMCKFIVFNMHWIDSNENETIPKRRSYLILFFSLHRRHIARRHGTHKHIIESRDWKRSNCLFIEKALAACAWFEPKRQKKMFLFTWCKSRNMKCNNNDGSIEAIYARKIIDYETHKHLMEIVLRHFDALLCLWTTKRVCIAATHATMPLLSEMFHWCHRWIKKTTTY